MFGLNLDKDFGAGTAEELNKKSKQIVKFSNNDLLQMIEDYKKKVKKLI